MNTIGEAISAVRNDFRLIHADARITNKAVYSKLTGYAAKLIKEESDKHKLTKVDAVWQALECQELIDVPTSDDCCRFKTRCTIKRLKNTLPDLFEDSDGVLIRTVTSIDYGISLQPIKYSEWIRKIENRSKYDKTMYYFYRNKYLYFPNAEWKAVTISGLFKENVERYNNCDGTRTGYVCQSRLDDHWNVPEYIQSIAIGQVIQEIASTYSKSNPEQEVQINKSPL